MNIQDQIFNEFKIKIMDQTYQPCTPLETLKARVTAVWLLQDADPALREKAMFFIKKTSVSKEEDVLRLQSLSARVKTWGNLDFCSIYTNNTGSFVEYKLHVVTQDDAKEVRHFHALYQIQDNVCCFVSQFTPLIRVIGDPVLHKPGILFPEKPTAEEQTELEKQIHHAKSVLIQTGGAGIAANQCAAIAEPYQFTIVGVFYDIAEHVEGVRRRYPGAPFPAAKIMVNPVVVSVTTETQQFNHACLSVPCSNRCEIKSPQAITVMYQDPTQEMEVITVTLKGVDAVVLWHELTHILEGKTYIDVAFGRLTHDDLNHCLDLIIGEQTKRRIGDYPIPELTVPPFYFTVKINTTGLPELDKQVFTDVLPKMTDETLAGLLMRCQQCLTNTSKYGFYQLVSAVNNLGPTLTTNP